jgi:predicted small secreted protein
MKVILSLFILMALSACANTLDGAGRDMEKMGQSLQRNF